MKKRFYCINIPILACLIFLLSLDTYAQDPHFTQSFYSQPLRLNPGIMGMNTDLKGILNYRTQWANIDKGYTTYGFTGLYPLFLKEGKEKLDVGLSVINDKAGAFSTFDAGLSIGYNLRIAKAGYLSFALQGGYIQKSLDASGLTFDDQYVLGSYSISNGTNQTVLNEKASHPDVGFGLMWYYNPDDEDAKLNAYMGASGFHLNEPNESFTENEGILPRKFSFQGGVKILGEEKIDFTPNVIANVQGGSEEFAGGLVLNYQVKEEALLLLGVWYRKKDAYPIMLGFEHKYFTLYYSYDISSSTLSRAVGGTNSHEITLSFKLNMADKKGVDTVPSMF